MICGKYLLDYWQDSYDNRQNYRQVEEIAFPEKDTEEDRTESNADNSMTEIKIDDFDYQALLDENADCIGWLKIDGIDISYPVVQGEDNEFYLHHDFQKNYASPWVNTNVLVYQIREQAFWQIENAPTYMLRMRQLFGVKELKSIFKLPIDDGNTIGLESRRTQSNKEKLNSRIMAEGSFKLGRIRNVIKSREAGTSEAGIPLNDFTQHGLIVGMPGTGKTNFSLGLLMQFWRDFQIPFLVIEPTKNEYRSLVDAIPDIQIFTPGKGDVSPYIYY